MDLQSTPKCPDYRMRNISVRISRSVCEQLEERAKADGVTRSKALQKAISHYLEGHEERSRHLQINRQLKQVSVISQETYELLKGLVEALSEISDSEGFK